MGKAFLIRGVGEDRHLGKHLLNICIFPLHNLVWKDCFLLLLSWWTASTGPALRGVLGPTPKWKRGAKGHEE